MGQTWLIFINATPQVSSRIPSSSSAADRLYPPSHSRKRPLRFLANLGHSPVAPAGRTSNV